MNLDHLFISLGYVNNEVASIAAIRTNRKGGVIGTFASPIGQSKDSQYPNERNAIRQLDETLVDGRGSFLFVIYERPFTLKPTASIVARIVDMVDIKSIAIPLVYSSAVSQHRTFEELCTHFQVRNDAPDTATGDCAALTQLYWAMIARYKTSLFAEEIVREKGGKPLQLIRNYFGV